MPEGQKIQWRRGTAAEWTTANPVLSEGTPGFEKDTGKFKVGDGVKDWKTLPYAGLQDVSVLPAASAVVDADVFGVADSADSFKGKKLSFAVVKAAIKAWWSVETATLSHKSLDNNTVYGTGVSHIKVEGGAAGFAPKISVESPDADQQLHLISKGNGAILLRSGVNKFFTLAVTNTAVDPGGVAGWHYNYLRVDNSDTTNPIIISAQTSGSGTPDVDISLRPRGSGGKVRVNTDEVVTLSAAQSISNKTLTTVTLASPNMTGTPTILGNPIGYKVAPPPGATSPGAVNQWSYDTGFFYVCVAANTWRRVALATW